MRRMSLAVLGIVLLTKGFTMFDQQPNGMAHALKESRQIILVTSVDWNNVHGQMRRLERDLAGAQWHRVGDAIPVVVGRNGMAWGKGLHGDLPTEGPVKKEGDGRSPAGIFSLSSAFGYAEKSQMWRLGLPYLQAVPTLECVDDVESIHYNRLLDRNSVPKPDWKSSEQMRRQDDLYRLGVVVDHNAGREAGCGSCIFLHIWAGPDKGTAGCTAMDAARMEEVLRWLDGKKNPLLVQLPESELKRFRKPWGLPE